MTLRSTRFEYTLGPPKKDFELLELLMGFKLKLDKRFTSKRPGRLAYLRLDSKDKIKAQTQAAPHDGK